MSTSTPGEENEQNNSELVIAITPHEGSEDSRQEEQAGAHPSRRVRVMSLPAINFGHQTQMPATASFAVLRTEH